MTTRRPQVVSFGARGQFERRFGTPNRSFLWLHFCGQHWGALSTCVWPRHRGPERESFSWTLPGSRLNVHFCAIVWGSALAISLQALVMWQWSRYLFRHAAELGKTPLILNLDETAVPAVFTDGKGTVMVQNGAAVWQSLPRLRMTKSETRIYFTHVAIICNRSDIQALLPQVLFVGAAALTRAQFAELQHELPDNVFLKRMPKGWNTADQHKVIVRILALILAEYPNLLPILSFDAAPIHLTPEVLAEIASGGLLFILVPARLTWLLQPLDTHVFFRYKLYLKQKFAESMAEAPGHKHKVALMIKLVIKAIRHVLQAHCWEAAFVRSGLWKDQFAVAAFIKRGLQYETLPQITDERPTPEMVRTCWPKNRTFHEDLVMNLIPPPGAPRVARAALAKAPGPPLAKASSGPSSSCPATPVAVARAPAATPKHRLRSKTTLLA